MVVTEGNSDKIVERFGAKKDGPLLLEQHPDFIVESGQDVYYVKA